MQHFVRLTYFVIKGILKVYVYTFSTVINAKRCYQVKRVLATLLVAVLLIAALPLSAAAKKEEGPKPGPGGNQSDYGYYYENMTDPVAKRAYEAIAKSKNVYSVKLNLPELNKYHYTDPRLGVEAGKIQQKILNGAWCWRYDHIAESDFFTNAIGCDISISYSSRTGMECVATIKLEQHPLYNPAMKTQRDAKIKAIAAEANKQPTLFAKLRSIHDQITAMGTYNYAAVKEKNQKSKTFFYAHSSLGILLEGTGVCESYAKIFQMVCDELDLAECICLVSKTHMWNAVKVEGAWYAVDVTWDDQESDKKPIHNYFLSTDPDEIDGKETDHVVDTTFTVAPDYADAAYRPEDTTVAMVAPTVSASNVSGGIALTWNKVDHADKYLVYRATVTKGTQSAWTKLTTTKSTAYTDGKATNGIDYTYSVVAQNDFTTSDHQACAVIRRLKNPAGALANTTGGIKVSWSKVTGASGYRVYRATVTKGKQSDWTLLTTSMSTSFTDKKAKTGADYRYGVQAYYGQSASGITASYTIRRLAATTISMTNTDKNVTVSWKEVAGAASYQVDRSSYSKGKWSGWKKVATTKKTSYADKSAKNGTKYRYKIRAFYGNSSSPDATSAAIVRLTATTAKVSKASKGFKVSWSKNKSASGYYVYRRQYSKGKWSAWTKVTSTKKTSYTDKKAKKGVNYQYTVRSVSGSSMSAVKAGKKVKR